MTPLVWSVLFSIYFVWHVKMTFLRYHVKLALVHLKLGKSRHTLLPYYSRPCLSIVGKFCKRNAEIIMKPSSFQPCITHPNDHLAVQEKTYSKAISAPRATMSPAPLVAIIVPLALSPPLTWVAGEDGLAVPLGMVPFLLTVLPPVEPATPAVPFMPAGRVDVAAAALVAEEESSGYVKTETSSVEAGREDVGVSSGWVKIETPVEGRSTGEASPVTEL